MMAGNLSIEKRKWIFKQYWKTENAERVRTAWVEAFNTPLPTRLTIYRIRDKFDATGSVANAPKSIYYILYAYFWPTSYNSVYTM